MLIDPRPYTYEFRKPRYGNPTLYFFIHSANQGTSMKVFTIGIHINPMITSPKMKEICTLLHKKYPKPTITSDKKNLSKGRRPISRIIDLTMHIIRAASLHLFPATLKNKWKDTNYPQSIVRTKEHLESSKRQGNIISKLPIQITFSEEEVLRDLECMKDSKSHTTSSAASLKKTKAIS